MKDIEYIGGDFVTGYFDSREPFVNVATLLNKMGYPYVDHAFIQPGNTLQLSLDCLTLEMLVELGSAAQKDIERNKQKGFIL